MDAGHGTMPAPQGRRDDLRPENDEAADGNGRTERRRHPEERAKRALLVPENPTSDKKLMLNIRVDSKTVVEWVNGHAKWKTPESTVAAAQNLMWKWWSRGVDLRRRVAEWAVHIIRDHD